MKNVFSFIKFQISPFARKRVLQLNRSDVVKLNAYMNMENAMNEQAVEDKSNIIIQNEFV
jgi:hypothetical protein